MFYPTPAFPAYATPTGHQEAQWRIAQASACGATFLDLQDLQITALPPEIACLPALTTLYLGGNQLTTLPREMGRLTSLTTLYLYKHNFESLYTLAAKTGRFMAFTTGYMNDHKGQLTTLPPEIGQLTALTTLNLFNCRLTTLPPEIGRLTALTTLDLGGNQLTTLPPEIGRLTTLTTLYLDCTRITTLPPEIGRLTALTTLYLGSTSLVSPGINLLATLPPEIGELTSIKEFYLGGNQLTNLPPEIGRLTALTTLDLGGNQLTTLPPEIGKLTALTEFDLSLNPFTSLQPEIRHLVALKTLSLSRTQLTTLPPEIGNLAALTTLDLSSNQITTLPPEIGNLTALTTLRQSSNQLTTLPPEIGTLTALTTLDLSSNQLTTLPLEIGNLTALTTLDLSSNQLTTLPPEIGNLTALTTLDLRHNKLRHLPDSLRYMTGLQILLLHGNPDLGLTEEQLGPDTQNEEEAKYPRNILEAYFALHRGRPKPLHEARLILLGDGAAGKTSALRQLMNGEACRPEESKTPGIAIHPWGVNIQRQNITLHAWDFGGQGEMHAAHPYFFGGRSLYLIVLKGREDHLVEQRLGYWLDMVRAYAGPEARVLVVQTHAAQHVARLDLAAWRQRHPGIVEEGFHTVESSTGAGVPELKAALVQVIAQMPEVWHEWPGAWMKVKDDLADHHHCGEPVLSMEGYADLCRRLEVASSTEQTALLKCLHDLGLVVAYPDDARLSMHGVLNPQWVCAGVYAILNAPELTLRYGLLTLEDAQRWLADKPGYPPRRVSGLLEIMARCDLAFPTGDGRRWIVPSHLDRSPLPAVHAAPFRDEDKPLRLHLCYQLLPETLITRFIARKHEHALAAGSQWWAHGVVLNPNNCPVLVDSTPGNNGSVRLHVAGPANLRRGVLAWLHHELDAMHTPAMREQMIEMVPLPHQPEVLVEYGELLELERAGEHTGKVRHRGRSVHYTVAELLDGVGRHFRGHQENHFHSHGDNNTMVAGNVHGSAVGGFAATTGRREIS